MTPWRLIDTGRRSGAWNMAVDEALWRGVQAGTSPPTLRFFAWEPATLSLGYAQSVDRDIDAEALGRLGVPLVRRPTGGRAVLHDAEFTYSVVFPESLWEAAPRPEGGAPAGNGNAPILRDYAAVSLGLVFGLRRLGVDATLAPASFRADPRDRTGACFSATSAFEVMAGGRKIVGSAQRRGGGAVLQHGSVPLDLDVDRLCALFRVRGEGARKRLAANLRRKTVSVNEALGGGRVGYADACRAFAAGFRKAFGRVEAGRLTPEEERLARTLAAEKYAFPEGTPAGR